jgi:hypothetical protein
MAALATIVLVAGTIWLSASADDDDVIVLPAVEDDGAAYLGVHLREEVDHEQGGARVTDVVSDSPAERAGLREDDIVLEFDGHVVRGPVALTQRIHARKPGDRVLVVVLRDGDKQKLEVELGERSDPVLELPVTPGPGVWKLDPERLEEWAEHLREQSRAWSEQHENVPLAPEVWSLLGSKPRLGVELVETTPELRDHLGGPTDAGVLVSRVLRGMPAERAGLRVGDLIVAVADHEIEDSQSLIRELDDLVGETFPVRIVRDKKTMTIEVTIEDAEEDVPTGPRAELRMAHPAPAPPIVPPVRRDPPAPPAAPAPPAPPAHPSAPPAPPGPPDAPAPPARSSALTPPSPPPAPAPPAPPAPLAHPSPPAPPAPLAPAVPRPPAPRGFAPDVAV